MILFPDGGEETRCALGCSCGAADRCGGFVLSPSEGERIKGGSLDSACFRFHEGNSGKMRFGSKASFRRRISFTGRSALGALNASRQYITPLPARATKGAWPNRLSASATREGKQERRCAGESSFQKIWS